MTSARVRLDDRDWQTADLTRKNQRLVVEQAAIAEVLLVEDLADEEEPLRPRLLNRPGVGEGEYV